MTNKCILAFLFVHVYLIEARVLQIAQPECERLPL